MSLAQPHQAVVVAPAGTVSTANKTYPGQDGLSRGIKVVLNVTAVTGTTPSATVTIQGVDAAGITFTQLVSAAVTATGTTVLTMYPGLPNTANVMANDVLPKAFNIVLTITGTTPSFTYSLSYELLP